MIKSILQLLLLAVMSAAPLCGQTEILQQVLHSNSVKIDIERGRLYLPATFHPNAYDGWFTHTKNYHAVVWQGGGASGTSPFTTPVDDATLYRTLVKLGAVPGNNLKDEAWAERKNRSHPAPDQRVQGSPVKLLVWWPALQYILPIDSLFTDPGGQGIELRFGGNLALIEKWHSGCIVCLYSCPGGKVSNRAYSIRDYVEKKTNFEINKKTAPHSETSVVLIFSLQGN